MPRRQTDRLSQLGTVQMPPPAQLLDGRTLRFRIGGWEYTASVAPGPLRFEGVSVLGTSTQSPREILIAADCPADDRLRVLLTELMSAWCFETGEPSTRDGWRELAATVAVSTSVDLHAQGGTGALVALRPLLPA